MSDLRTDVNRGVEAAQLLNHPLLMEALNAIEADVVAQWESCPARDAEGKEACWQLIKTAKKFRAILNGYIQTGKLAADQIKRFEEESKLRKLGKRLKVI